MKFKKVLLFWLFTIFGGSPSIFANAIDLIEIRILPETKVETDYFTLGDVSEIDGFDLEAIQKVARLDLGAAPKVGVKLRLSAMRIKNLAVRTFPEYRLNIISPPKAHVERKSDTIREDEIKAILHEAMEAKYGQHGNHDFEIISKVPRIALPSGQVEHKATETGRNHSPNGIKNWRISFFVDGKLKRNIYLRTAAQVNSNSGTENLATENYLSASRQKSPKLSEMETDPDIQVIRKRQTPSESKEMSQLENYRMKNQERQKSKAFYANARQFASSPDVIRGKRVVLKYTSPHIELKTLATPMQNGKIGDIIMVKNLTSNKIVQAEIIEKNTVKVSL